MTTTSNAGSHGHAEFRGSGHVVELFTYDPAIAVPEWIVRRDANEIWPTDHILSYRNGISRGSFALHANLFRYAMLHRLGGWWIDQDVILLRQELPAQDIFFSLETVDPMSGDELRAEVSGRASRCRTAWRDVSRSARRRAMARQQPCFLPRW